MTSEESGTGIQISRGEDVVLMLNNLGAFLCLGHIRISCMDYMEQIKFSTGGTTNLEMGVLAKELLSQAQARWKNIGHYTARIFIYIY